MEIQRVSSVQAGGIILVDKPEGMTSHDVVDCVRRKLKIKRVGHAGTLDPMATGLLIILVGKATRYFNKFQECNKTYSATMRLGVVTDSGDSTGKILSTREVQVTEDQVRAAVKSFEGEIEQVPPMVSALRHKGKRLYEIAREGKVVERAPRKITIKNITVEQIALPMVDFVIECSKGTYIRKLAEDIGEKLICGGCIVRIRRLSIGAFDIKHAYSLDTINEHSLQTVTFRS
jgi:tRNA pseudouridine55 synthase